MTSFVMDVQVHACYTTDMAAFSGLLQQEGEPEATYSEEEEEEERTRCWRV